MKRLLCLSAITVSCIFPSSVFAQSGTPPQGSGQTRNTAPASNVDPFAKGHWQYQLMENFEYDHMKVTENGGLIGHTHDLSFNLAADYFVAEGFGLGLDLSLNSASSLPNGSILTTTDWIVYANAIFGRPLSPAMGLYGKASFGYGDIANKYEYLSSSSKSSNSQYGYKLEVGAPIRLFPGSLIYLTPMVTWHQTFQHMDQGKMTNNGLQIGLGFQSYLGCSDYGCDGSHGFSLSRHAYDQGHSFIDFSSLGSMQFGSQKTTYNSNPPVVAKQNLFEDNFSLIYGYYVLPYIALGGGVDIAGASANNASGNYKTSSNFWSVSPMAEFNLPVENGWNNTFLQIQVGLGVDKSTTTVGSTTNTDTQDFFSFSGMIGYNDFIARRLAFTPKIGYAMSSLREKGADDKQTSGGIAIAAGIRLFF